MNKKIFDEAVISAKGNAEYSKGTTQIKMSSISAPDFVSKVKWSMPSALVRSLSSEFLTGVTASVSKPEFFAILKVKDYGIAFRDMLGWEDDMVLDFAPIIFASTTAVSDFEWNDLIVKNKDARALYYSGKIRLIYTFINQNTVLITESESSMTALVNSFVTGNAVR